MALADILKQQSTWTYNMMASSAELGEMIREDALTTVNLSEINQASMSGGFGLSTTSLQGSRLEKEFGADWVWNLGDTAYAIQAKRLDVIKNAGLVSYQIKIPQLRVLLNSTEGPAFAGVDATAYYVFYNTYMNGGPENVGCIMVEAKNIWNAILQAGKSDQKTVLIRPDDLDPLNGKYWWQYFSG